LEIFLRKLKNPGIKVAIDLRIHPLLTRKKDFYDAAVRIKAVDAVIYKAREK
jgi:hypothetical protein